MKISMNKKLKLLATSVDKLLKMLIVIVNHKISLNS